LVECLIKIDAELPRAIHRCGTIVAPYFIFQLRTAGMGTVEDRTALFAQSSARQIGCGWLMLKTKKALRSFVN
jgi:hypothetical protein